MTSDHKCFEVTCVMLPKEHWNQVPWKFIKICGYSDPFLENLKQMSLTPTWLLTPCLLRWQVWLYPRNIVSKSYGNTSMYVGTVINCATNTTYYMYIPHTHTMYRMSDHIVSFWTQFKRDTIVYPHIVVNIKRHVLLPILTSFSFGLPGAALCFLALGFALSSAASCCMTAQSVWNKKEHFLHKEFIDANCCLRGTFYRINVKSIK